jgi:hypothetical protein
MLWLVYTMLYMLQALVFVLVNHVVVAVINHAVLDNLNGINTQRNRQYADVVVG